MMRVESTQSVEALMEEAEAEEAEVGFWEEEERSATPPAPAPVRRARRSNVRSVPSNGMQVGGRGTRARVALDRV
jgi:hypothetical protein